MLSRRAPIRCDTVPGPLSVDLPGLVALTPGPVETRQ